MKEYNDKNYGWIAIHRKLRHNWLWQQKPFSPGQAWIDILLRCNHKPNEFLMSSEVIKVDRGEFITSIKKLADDWGWSRTKVRRFVHILNRKGTLEIHKKDTKKTLLKVHHYSIYQDIETQKEHKKNTKRTQKEHIKDTNNNDNNDNNDKQKERRSGNSKIPPPIENIIMYFQEQGITGENGIQIGNTFFDHYNSNGWMVGKSKMKDWKATVRNWVRRNKGEIKAKTPDRHKIDEAPR